MIVNRKHLSLCCVHLKISGQMTSVGEWGTQLRVGRLKKCFQSVHFAGSKHFTFQVRRTKQLGSAQNYDLLKYNCNAYSNTRTPSSSFSHLCNSNHTGNTISAKRELGQQQCISQTHNPTPSTHIHYNNCNNTCSPPPRSGPRVRSCGHRSLTPYNSGLKHCTEM